MHRTLRQVAGARVSGALLLLLAGASALAAQQGALQGSVTDAETGTGVPTALVTAAGQDGREAGTALTNRDGQYRIALPPGSYTLTVSAIGYGTQEMGSAQVSGTGTATSNATVGRRTIELAPLVVSVGRTYEKAITAPAHVEVVSQEVVRSRPTITPIDHVRSIPGVDVISQGLQSTNVVVRGFNNIFSGALQTLTDNRIASVPSLRVNVMNFVPTTDEDIERIEIVLGPGSALYGPNTANGVMHMITRSPLTSPGSSVSLMAGERSVLGGTVRISGRPSETLGLKISGQYLQGDEWIYQDSVEVAEVAKFESDPAFWRQDLMSAAGIDQAEADRRVARVAARDFSIERWSGELRADWAIDESTTAVFTTGISNAASQIELTGLGAGQVDDWRYKFYQARVSRDRLFAQLYLNQSDAGDTFLLRNGSPIVDHSELFVAQLQHGATLGARQAFTYGLDFIWTNPDTEGTVNGAYEDEDQTTEVGGYIQSETELTPTLDFVLTGRVDEHSALPDPVFSPRAALVYEPVQGQVLRLTFNRSFSTPTSINQFLDLGTASPDRSAGLLGFSVRVQGTGERGFSFAQPDGSYLMRVPALLGGPDELLLADDIALFWPAAVGVLAQQAAALGRPIPQDQVNYLLTLQPTPEDIAPGYRDPVTDELGLLANREVRDLAPIRESTQTGFEVGYKGLLAGRTVLAADVWYSRIERFVTPLTVQTPFVTLAQGSVATYLVPRLQAIRMEPAVAEATAAELAAGIAAIPVGVVSSADVNANGAQLLATYSNFEKDIELWGVDLSATYLLNDVWSVSGSASFVNEDSFTSERGQTVVLNAPKSKGGLTISYHDYGRGVDAELHARFKGDFPAASGVYEGLACIPAGEGDSDPCVDSSTLVDLNVSHRIPGFPSATVQLSVQNLFDRGYRSFPGVAPSGRLGLVRLRYEF